MKFSLFFLIGLIILTGCNKQSNPTGDSNRDIYCAGFDNGYMVYWKNGVETILSSVVGYEGDSYGIAVTAGKDVYVVGDSILTGIEWKNGISNDLSGNPSQANCITISQNNDVYVGGSDEASSNEAVYWKNGVETILSTSNELTSVNSILVSGNDIYAVGYIGDSAAYWKNGIKQILQKDYSTASSIALSGSDVYIAGTHNDNPVYWKNGIETVLSNQTTSSATGIALAGSDLYVTGSLGASAVYWKNGVQTTLATSDLGVASANAIFVDGSDVYIAGYVDAQSGYSAIYWKNNVRVTVKTSPSPIWGKETINSIVVINK
jgi:hypothetical protein